MSIPYFLSISGWMREERYKLDKRTSKIKNECAIDFSLRQKHKRTWIAVEFKQNNSSQACIKEMFGDILKVSQIKKANDDIRTLWCVGIHKHEDPKKILGHIAKLEIHSDIIFIRECIITKRIGKSSFSFTIFWANKCVKWDAFGAPYAGFSCLVSGHGFNL